MATGRITKRSVDALKPGDRDKLLWDSEKMERYIRGSELLNKSIYQKMTGDEERSLVTLRRACDANPENEELPFLIRFYY